ncbi:MAG TPA: transcription antitermination factor NusB, partial [Elusimicrobiales bacterium]|nr:transcription antitermination factor NusB [Elusimicrobiales bacterium]
ENIGIMKDPSTMDFYKNLFLITVEHIKEIDEIIRTASKKWDFDGIFPIDKAILRMATAEMVYLKNQVPIVIDEAVEISKMYSPNEEKGPDFINGVLDTIAKTNVLK